MSADVPERLGYRPGLDGIRALAIVFVMASHAHPSLLKGGELGVDVFFALSGFLITTVILEEVFRLDGGYGFVRFYVRRGLRLFPALYAMLLAVVIYLAFRWNDLPEFLATAGVHEPEHRRLYGRFLFGAATYSTNLIGVLATPGNFLGHTWSLALEQQFYLIWPVILVTFWRRRELRTLTWLVLGFILVCLAARLAGVPADRGFLWMRPEAIAAGAFGALIRWDQGRAHNFLRRNANVFSIIGLIVVVVVPLLKPRIIPGVYFDRGLVTLFGIGSAVLIYALVEVKGRPLVVSLLTWRPIVRVGLISYGLYVWHLPVFRVVTWELPGLGGTANILVKVAISVVVAEMSFRFIEQPFRQRQARFRTVEQRAGAAASGLDAH
ncbi:MAG: acyltransferase [Acidimicrobiia bacterium]|nr:acyltransferase [Acidimicrobiia bacterium]